MITFKQYYLTEAANLGGSELHKYDWRVQLFLDKFKDELAFEMVGGALVKFNYDAAIESQIRAKRDLSKIEFTAHNGVKYKLKDFAKSKEFGGGGGSGAGADVTKTGESAQCVYAQALWNKTKNYNDDDLKQAYKHCDVDENIENILSLDAGWKKSSILGAELLYKKFGSKNYTFHRGSSWVDKLQKLYNQLNRVGKPFGNINKWSPADIYMVSSVGAALKLESATDFIELNSMLFKALESKDIIGVSCKKMVKVAKINYYNYDEEKKLVEFDKFTTGSGSEGFFSSKDIYIYFTVNGKVQFRTFSEQPGSWQGEIKGKIAQGGKLGYGPIQGVLRRLGLKQLTDVKVLKAAIDKKDPIMLKTFYKNYSRYANDSKKLTYDEFKDQVEVNGKSWLFSKYIGLELIHIITDSNRQDDFITGSIQYASSTSELSAPFIKIHSE